MWKALTLWQPWASAIAEGAKRIETRNWQTSYRGSLLIHAAKHRLTVDEYVELAYLPAYQKVARLSSHQPGMAIARHFRDHLPFGCIIAVCELVDCCPIEDSPDGYKTIARSSGCQVAVSSPERALGNYEAGRYGWVLAKVRKLPKPIPYKGRQGLWTPSPELIKEVTSAHNG